MARKSRSCTGDVKARKDGRITKRRPKASRKKKSSKPRKPRVTSRGARFGIDADRFRLPTYFSFFDERD